MEKVKQTAVEWLVNEINKLDMPINDSQHDIALDIIDKAKQMEKEQILDAYIMGVKGKTIAEFNKTFKSE
jgi:hypothetical protein